MRWWRAAGAAALVAAAVVWACGGSGSGDVGAGRDGGPPPTDSGGPDAGPPDSGPPDAGPPDAGPPDAGPPDGGFNPPPPIPFPTVPGWSFIGPQNGGPHDVFQVSADQGGNLWVAGGADGLFLLRPGSTTLQRFTIADGLHPYGYMPDGSPADKNPSLSATPVIAVQGGPAGTVFVGYQGKPGCEDDWDGPNPDPANYKSGDADRVTVDANGKLTVVHYDIFSGPGVVGAELRGREKLCSVYRIAWDPAQDKVWFGANHGFAVGTADYPGNPTCNGQYPGNQSRTNCAGVWEHSHPHIGGCSVEQTPCPSNKAVLLTDSYYGAAVDPATHDVWFGGLIRTTKYHYGTYGGGLGAYYNAEEDTETQGFAPGTCTAANPRGKGIPCAGDDRWDLWPDKVPECTPRPTATNPNNCESNYVTPGQRNDDAVSGIVALADRTAWVSSFAQGLVRIDSFGKVLEDPSAKLMTTFVSALGRDPSDGSLWAGMSWGPGITRYDPAKGAATNYSTNLFGDLAWARIGDVQADATVTPRRMLVAFRQNGSTPGFVAIYSGN